MATPVSRRPYHEWTTSTPLLDVARTLVAVASVMILGYDLIFAAYAMADDNWGLVAKYGIFVAAVGAANLAMDVLIRWRRHHG
jgi:hypothetical protein